MGLPNDSQKSTVWVDTYASEFSRDIEPTVEGGSTVYDVATSCIRIYKKGQTCADIENKSEELCCDESRTLVWNNVWSLNNTSTRDRVLTIDVTERDALIRQDDWEEICATIGGPTAFCVDTNNPDGREGPFMVYNSVEAVSHRNDDATAVGLYRCIINSNVTHFLSNDPSCEGAGTMESVLGWTSSQRGGETLRELRRCSIDGRFTHALDLPCVRDSGKSLGFVR